ncbi:MAG: head fiber protein [Prevotella sp.]|jgi:hypothetical protein|nr:hypothetical protein [Prevotella sp.]MCI1474360.1 head fiber protein [Prevotella sp.]MCI1596084.1 head fiber protein [Prevotella sp.]
MASGFVYNLPPKEEEEERYDVSSGVRRRGPYVLNVDGLAIGSWVPSFIPIAADLVKKTANIVVNVLVMSDVGATDTTIQIKKGSYLTKGMFIGNGSAGATVVSINNSNEAYDVVTIDAAMGAVSALSVLFQAKTKAGKAPVNVANSALYENHKVTVGINNVALLQKAFEIEPDKLAVPFSANDKANLPYFQFNE